MGFGSDTYRSKHSADRLLDSPDELTTKYFHDMAKHKRHSEVFPRTLADACNRGGLIPRVFPNVAGNNLRGSFHKSHRETNGLRVHKRDIAKPVLPTGRSLAFRSQHQLLLFRTFHDGIRYTSNGSYF